MGCGTLSFYDADGARLTTVRMARMTEPKKATLKSMLSAELTRALNARPGLTLVKLADGAKDNWTYLHDLLPAGVELVDFYHAVTHLKTAFDAAYGEHTPKARSQFEKYRHILLEDEDGVGKVIRAFAYLRDQHPRRTQVSAIQRPPGDFVYAIGPLRACSDNLEFPLFNVQCHPHAPRISAAASITALMILSYPVHRHRLPASQ